METTATGGSAALKAPARRLLPAGIRRFSMIRENGYAYVDKTPQIYPLINGIALEYTVNPYLWESQCTTNS
jgi:hypothetical protein